jgi:RING/Ubox like zinc-binding domain
MTLCSCILYDVYPSLQDEIQWIESSIKFLRNTHIKRCVICNPAIPSPLPAPRSPNSSHSQLIIPIIMESDRVLDGEDGDYTCPLCVEEFDIHDRNFKPCPCGYQVCPFCWNHIRNNLNGLCPACRRPYSDQPEWKPTAAEEYLPLASFFAYLFVV